MFLAGHTVAVVTYCVTKKITTCSPLIWQFFETMIVASSDKEAHQNLTAGNCFEPRAEIGTDWLPLHTLAT